MKRCESLLKVKEEEAAAANKKLAKLQQECEYTRHLLAQRDAELAKYEEKVADLENSAPR